MPKVWWTGTRLNLVSGHYGGVAKQKVSTDYSQPRDWSVWMLSPFWRGRKLTLSTIFAAVDLAALPPSFLGGIMGELGVWGRDWWRG